MLGRRFVVWAAIVVLTPLVVSCAVLGPASSGKPAFDVSPIAPPTFPTEEPTPTATTPAPSASRPNGQDGAWKPSPRLRTRDLDLSKMKNCAALDDVPVTRWQVKPGRPVGEALKTGTVSCSWAYRKPPYALTLIKYQQSIYDGYIFSETEPTEIEVRGFPAWTGQRMEVRPICLIEIDIQDDQYLAITYNVTGPIKDNTVDCDRLPDIGAELVDALLR
ncbi:DUF3558 family protein [Microlunatus sp. GCM10028923]|uniref:DUF3558 family protein n=1 Tax=Microlunatus sp. GCM10028923 TaxID=3273400 RepID=UPI0036140B3C